MKLRKLLLSVMVLVVVTMLCVIGAGAQTLTSGDYEYEQIIRDDHEV